CERRCGKGGCLAGPASEAGWSARRCRSCWHTESGNGGNGSPQPAPVFLFVGRSPETRCHRCRGRLPYRAPVCWRSRRNRHHAREAESARPVVRQPNGQGPCLDRRLSSEPPPSKHASPSVPAWSPPARSGSERPRPPPQVGPQPMHPVRQNISGHSEVCGDIGVPPAVYGPVLQQPAVVRGQVPEEGAKSVNSYGSHWGDLGGQDDTPGQAGFPGVLFLPSGRFGPRHTWEYLQAQRKASEVPKLSISSCGDAPQGGWGFQRLLFGRGCGLSAPGSRQGYGFTAAHDFWSTTTGTPWSPSSLNRARATR